MDKNAGPIRPKRALGNGQVSVISQSGGLGFAFFDRARPRNLTFRHIVTTGNEAALEVFDLVDYMLDEGGTDVFLLLLEDVKSPEKFKRVAEKALRLGKPLIVGKIGQSEAGSPRRRLAHRGARRLAGRLPRHVRALRPDRGARSRRDARSRGRLPRLRRQAAGGQARRHLHLLGRRRRVDGGCLRRRRASTCRSSTTPRANRSTSTSPPTAPRRTRSIPPRRACRRWATRPSRGWWRSRRSSTA